MPTKLSYFPSAASELVGDVMNGNPSKGHLRFWVQNCNGLKPKDNSNLNNLFTQIHEYNMHYFAFTETNVNVSNPQVVSQIHRNLKCRFRSGRMSLTNTPGFPNSTQFQPGGVYGGFTTTLNSRFISSEQDKLGRWICHTFRGKERDIRVYTIYRVHRKTDDTSGLTSAWMQQRTLLREQNIMANPRDAIIDDMRHRIKRDIESNKAVILMGDFNEGIVSKEKTNEKLLEIGLVNLMQERINSDLPKTWNRGTNAIDHVYMTIDVYRSVRKSDS